MLSFRPAGGKRWYWKRQSTALMKTPVYQRRTSLLTTLAKCAHVRGNAQSLHSCGNSWLKSLYKNVWNWKGKYGYTKKYVPQELKAEGCDLKQIFNSSWWTRPANLLGATFAPFPPMYLLKGNCWISRANVHVRGATPHHEPSDLRQRHV